MTNNDKKKYKKMENVLTHIHGNYVTISEEDVKRANPVLKHVIPIIIDSMRAVSPLFKSIFERVFFGGSYYDGLKVSKPEEFDLDLVLNLTKLQKLKYALKDSNQPGFMNIQILEWNSYNKDTKEMKEFEKLLDKDRYLITENFIVWMESIVNKAINLNKIEKHDVSAMIPFEEKIAKVHISSKSGPAITARIVYDGVFFEMDLVAALKMTEDRWPLSPYLPIPPECQTEKISNNINIKEFFLVPKSPKEDFGAKKRCWRFSFQIQERVLLDSKNRVKPALRLIKKLRDNKNHKKISSYYLKTVFLHEIEKQKNNENFWDAQLSFIFMHMLTTYKDYLKNGKIPYYWNKRNNLIKPLNDKDRETIKNFSRFLEGVIDEVNKKIDTNIYIIAKYLLTEKEFEETMALLTEIPEPSYIDEENTNRCIIL